MSADLVAETGARTTASRKRDDPVLVEQDLLSALMDGAPWPAGLEASMSQVQGHPPIFSAIAALHAAGTEVAITLVADRLQGLGQLAACGGLEYLNAVALSRSTAKIETLAQLVIERAAKRRDAALRHQAEELLRSDAPPEEAIAIIEQIGKQKSVPPPKVYPLLSVSDLHGLPPLTWRIHGVFPTVGLAAIFGPKGSAKSFLALSMLAAIAEGEEWFGYRVKPGRGLYVGLEAPAGIRLRVKAWERANGRPFPDAVCFQFQPFNLTERDDVLALATAIDAHGGVDVIVIDTLNRASSTVDENSSEGMGQILDGATLLQAMTGALVVLVHHTGKNAALGMRGHSSLIGALDGAIEATREGGRREWKVDKVKDGEDGAIHEFRITPIDLGYDDDGEPLTSCVVMPPYADDEAPAGPRAKLPKGGNQRIVYDALGPLLRASGIRGRAGAPAIRPCITLEDAIEGTKERLAVEPRRRGERARQAITSLAASGVVGLNEGWLWLI